VFVLENMRPAILAVEGEPEEDSPPDDTARVDEKIRRYG